MTRRRLVFLAPGASSEDAARGLAAANLFLQRVGIGADEAVAGAQARAAWGDSGLAPLLEPRPEDVAAADALDGALESAIMACYRGKNVPLDVELRLSS